MSEDKSKIRRTVIEISAAAGALLFIAGLGLAFYFRLIPMPRFMRVIFNMDYSESETEREPEDEIPDIKAALTDGGEVYFDLIPAELFGRLREAESYSCRIKLITVWGSRRSSERCSLVKDGARFRAESEDRLTIFDGEVLYTKTAGQAYRAAAEGCDCYSELGITSLAELKKADIKEENLTLSDDLREIGVTLYDGDGQLTDEYRISVESGIITEEYHYSGGVVYRSAVRENIETDVGEADFTVPED